MTGAARQRTPTPLRALCIGVVLLVVAILCLTVFYDYVSHTGCGPSAEFFRSRRIAALLVTAATFALMSLNWWLDDRGSSDGARAPIALRLVLNGSVAVLCGLTFYDYLISTRGVLEC